MAMSRGGMGKEVAGARLKKRAMGASRQGKKSSMAVMPADMEMKMKKGGKVRKSFAVGGAVTTASRMRPANEKTPLPTNTYSSTTREFTPAQNQQRAVARYQSRLANEAAKQKANAARQAFTNKQDAVREAANEARKGMNVPGTEANALKLAGKLTDTRVQTPSLGTIRPGYVAKKKFATGGEVKKFAVGGAVDNRLNRSTNRPPADSKGGRITPPVKAVKPPSYRSTAYDNRFSQNAQILNNKLNPVGPNRRATLEREQAWLSANKSATPQQYKAWRESLDAPRKPANVGYAARMAAANAQNAGKTGFADGGPVTSGSLPADPRMAARMNRLAARGKFSDVRDPNSMNPVTGRPGRGGSPSSGGTMGPRGTYADNVAASYTANKPMGLKKGGMAEKKMMGGGMAQKMTGMKKGGSTKKGMKKGGMAVMILIGGKKGKK